MPLVSQALWGWLFSAFMEFSFTTLRISTLTLSLLGIIFFFSLVLKDTKNTSLAFFGSIYMMLMPLYFSLSYTFMTDIPFTAAALLSILLLNYDLRSPNWRFLVLATAIIVVTVLVRQLAIALPLGYAIALLVRDGLRWRSVLRSLVPLGAAVGAYGIFSSWLSSEHGLPYFYSFHAKKLLLPFEDPATWFMGMSGMGIKFALIIGFFMLPVLGLFLKPILRNFTAAFGKRISIAVAVAFTFLYGFWNFYKAKPPILDSTLKDFGLGEILLRDVYFLGMEHWPTAPDFLWRIVMFFCLAGVALFLMLTATELFKIIRNNPNRITRERLPIIVLYVATAFIYLGPLTSAGPGGFDRYTIFPIALFSLATLAIFGLPKSVNTTERTKLIPSWLVGGVALTIFGTFSIMATHDYLNFQRARWAALEQLTEQQKIPYTAIDGGMEFNCLAWVDDLHSVREAIKLPKVRPGKSWWCVTDDQYLVTLGPVPGYLEVESFPFKTWIPGEDGKVLILVRDEIGNTKG